MADWITQKEKPKSWITKKKSGTKAPGTPPKKKRFRDSPYPQFSQEFKPKIKAFKGGGAVTRFRSSGPEGKPHSTKEGRSAEAQRAYMRKHGKPDKKRIQIRPKVSDRMQKLRDNLASVSGGEWGKKSGGRIGKEAPRQKKKIPIITVVGDSEGLRDAKKIKGKPHSSPEGRVLSHIRTSSPFVVKKAKGGRIGLQHGNRPRPQGPHTWVKSGGAVLKGKKVGIQIK